MEPPCLVEEMSGGGSGMGRGLTAAKRPPSCGRPTIAGWPPCWNAENEEQTHQFNLFTTLVLLLMHERIFQEMWQENEKHPEINSEASL